MRKAGAASLQLLSTAASCCNYSESYPKECEALKERYVDN